MICFIVYFFNYFLNLLISVVAFIFFATYLVPVPSQESSFDKYVYNYVTFLQSS